MLRKVLFLLILSLIASACAAPAPTVTEAPAPVETEEEIITPQPILPETTATPEPTQTSIPAPTATATPTVLPTDTPLPPLELPTEMLNAPLLLAWDGTPTYLGDSQPGYDFRVFYNPDVWALTQDQFGFPAIGHRTIPYCVVSVTSGRGLPPNVSVEQDVLYVDDVTFFIGTAFENGVKKFVTYTGGDGRIVSGFEVSFVEQSDQCIADAQAVLVTLRSIPSSRATPEP
jgi:hypothetical protein